MAVPSTPTENFTDSASAAQLQKAEPRYLLNFSECLRVAHEVVKKFFEDATKSIPKDETARGLSNLLGDLGRGLKIEVGTRLLDIDIKEYNTPGLLRQRLLREGVAERDIDILDDNYKQSSQSIGISLLNSYAVEHGWRIKSKVKKIITIPENNNETAKPILVKTKVDNIEFTPREHPESSPISIPGTIDASTSLSKKGIEMQDPKVSNFLLKKMIEEPSKPGLLSRVNIKLAGFEETINSLLTPNKNEIKEAKLTSYFVPLVEAKKDFFDKGLRGAVEAFRNQLKKIYSLIPSHSSLKRQFSDKMATALDTMAKAVNIANDKMATALENTRTKAANVAADISSVTAAGMSQLNNIPVPLVSPGPSFRL